MPTLRRPGRPARTSETRRPLMALLDLLGRRWLMRVVWELRSNEPLTFRELQARCGDISASVLARRVAELREVRLLADGERAVGYRLTPLGRDLLEVIAPLLRWADRWQSELDAAQFRAGPKHRPAEAVRRRPSRPRGQVRHTGR